MIIMIIPVIVCISFSGCLCVSVFPISIIPVSETVMKIIINNVVVTPFSFRLFMI